MEHFTSGRPVLTNGESHAGGNESDDSEVVQQIRAILDQHIRPAVAQDGGDIVFHSFEDGIVYLTLRGACAGCPGATATLKMGVENMLRRHIPEVREVRQKR